jgi:hypothetical protein
MPFPRRSRPVLVAICVVPAFGCQEFGAGPCEHTYRDPVLAVTAATDEASRAPVTPVFITGVTVGGQLQPPSFLLIPPAFGARAQGDTIVCGVPCGFGTSEGRYAFVASAPGYAPRTIAVDARFARFDGGCPSFNEGSTRTAIALPRSP